MLWQRGSLSAEQVDLVMQHLPCDVSFADEDDTLLYWSGDTYKTCDPRFIGRDVRDCHPAESLEMLETILGEFKAGRHDVAEGWESKKGRLKYTRYTAVRDADGTYKGILEIGMDVTDFHTLSGEQKMPGW